MKDMLSESIQKKLTETLESTGGAKALFGDPVTLNGQEVVPVARVSVVLGADAEGSGGGDSGALAGLAKGGGGGNAGASVRVDVEPVGYLRAGDKGPQFVLLGDDAG